MSIELKSALEHLQHELDERLRDFERHPPTFGNPELMRQAAQKIRKHVDGVSQVVSHDRIQEALTLLYKEGLDVAFSSRLRYLCWGLLAEWGTSKRQLLHDAKLFPAMLKKLKQLSVDSVLPLSAWRGLLQAYFNFDPSTKDAADQTHWRHLRDFLAQSLPTITIRNKFHPAWLEVINTHANLLSEHPCERYGAAILAGDESEINRLRDDLQIPENSWFWSRLLLTQVKCLVECSDSDFQTGLARVLGLLDKYGWVRDQALVMLLERYATSSFRSTAHPELRDFALNTWGTPHLERNIGWNQVNADAKQMFRSWLVIRALDDFFKLLQENRATDQDRLRFWRRYEGSIEYFHFALGPDAYESQDTDYINFRKTFREQVCRLINPGRSGNNAFIFKIGNYYLVEFGATGNAFYCYNKDRIPFKLAHNYNLISSSDLKVQRRASLRLTHIGAWEKEFEHALSSLGIVKNDKVKQTYLNTRQSTWQEPKPILKPPAIPSGQIKEPDLSNNDPYAVAIALAQQNKISYWDDRLNHGVFWVYFDYSTGPLAERLQQLGFRFYNGRGWWRRK